MKNILAIFAFSLLSVSGAMAGPDSLAKANKLMEQRRFDDAWIELHSNLNSIEAANKDPALFTLASIFHNDAMLYQSLYKAAVSSEMAYLEMLLKDKSKNKSRYAPLAAAALYFEMGNCKKTSESIVKLDASEKDPSVVGVKNLLISSCKFMSDGKFETFIESNKGSVDALLAALAIASQKGKSKQAIAYFDKSGLKIDKVIKETNIIGLSGYIATLRLAGRLDDALRAISMSDKTKYLVREENRSGRVIVFYAPNLLREMSNTYSDASVFYFSGLAQGGKYDAIGKYLLAERNLYKGDVKSSVNSLDSVLGKGKLPQRLEERASVTSKIAKASMAKKSDAGKLAADMVSSAGEKYDVMVDAIWSCALVNGDCGKALNLVAKKAETADRKKGKPMLMEVGKFLETDKRHTQAIAMMEAVRDKANKNKIEYNDPLMFVSLAEAYRNTKNYSENLEIYFEMSKHYPAVRVIQDSVQGVYSVEQKSAGDVKIF